jgi:transcriptional regulator with AAA-type ATPase domain/predicted ATPase
MNVLSDVIGDSPGVVAVRRQIQRLLQTWSNGRRPPPVLIQGETGTGKGLLARSLHRASPRADRAFVHINCAAVPEPLLEAELFGYDRGAFTDAWQPKPGLFQTAHRGTLFLDEVGLLPLALQAKLLSVIEEQLVRRLGATRAEPVDVWVIAATNEDLAEALRARRFREDLYYRLAVVNLMLPPLRARGADLMVLAERFLAQACEDYGLPVKTLGTDARAALAAHPWPGNIRELHNVIERGALLADAPVVSAAELALSGAPVEAVAGPAAGPSARDVMREHLEAALERADWNISRAALLLGVSRNTVKARIARLQPKGRGSGEMGARADAGAEPAVSRSAAWERRHLTLLRVCLTAAPGATVDLPPGRPLDAARDKIRGFHGRIEGLSPTTVLAVFGLAPVDEPATFAAHSAMVVHNALKEADGRVAATIGLHSADILVQTAARVPSLDVETGLDAWNRLEAAMAGAEPGTIVVTSSAAELLRRRFALRPLDTESGSFRIDGLWHAQAGAARPRAHLVGRAKELAALERHLASAVRGHGQVVDIVGEAGIGKSRLLAELATRARSHPARYLEGRCLPTETHTPFFPFLQILRTACGIANTDSARAIEDKVTAALMDAGLDPAELGPTLLALLHPSASPPPAPSAAVLKRRFFTAIQRLLFAQSRQRPLILALEDLHWVDPTSDACSDALLESIEGTAVLFVTTRRPGYRPGRANAAHGVPLPLAPLSAEDSVAVIRQVLDDRPPPPELVKSIRERAEGNPLFLEELSRAAVDRGEGAPAAEIPSTVEDTIGARLARLPARHRRLLAVAAVIGRDLSLPLLRDVAGVDDETLRTALSYLERADVLHESAAESGERRYTFKHALVQEVAYSRIPGAERRALHGRVLEAIEHRHADRLIDLVEQLAHHAVRGNERPRAVRYLLQAGQKAAMRSALIEALGHLDNAQELLRALPENAGRDRRELELELFRAGALRATKGFAAPEVGQACARAMELCHRLDDRAQLLPTLNGVYSFHLMRAEYARAGDAAAELLALAERLRNATFEMIGHRAVGAVLFHAGRFGEARASLERALALYDDAAHGSLASLYGTDHAQVTSCFLGLVRWALGDPAGGRGRLEWAIAHSERLGHVHSIGLALSYLGILLIAGREYQVVAAPGERLAELSARHHLTVLGASARFYLAAARLPRTPGTIDEMHRAAEAWWATQAVSYRPFVEVVMAEAHGDIGDVDGGLRLIHAALGRIETTNERWIEPEAHRVRGTLLAADPRRAGGAQDWLRRAVDVARAQAATMWELRAAIDLAVLLRREGHPAHGRELLEPLLARFPAELETPDLAAGRAALASLC